MRSRGCCSSFEDFGATHYPLRSKETPLNPSAYEDLMQSMWNPRGVPLKSMRNPCEIPVKSLWNLCEIPVRSLSNACEMPVQSLWNPYEILVKSVWDAYAIPTKVRNSCEMLVSQAGATLRCITILCRIAKYSIWCKIIVEIVCFSNLGRAAKILKIQKFYMQRFGTCKIMQNLNLISTCSRFPSATTTKKEQHQHQ